jgi:hypothetical protein
MNKFKVFCILALVALIAAPAFAEVQNVKVSGDLAARWILRATYDLDKNDTGINGNNLTDYIQGLAEVQVDADLTDNVSTKIRLINQRDWSDVRQEVAPTTQFDVIVDLASVTLKELVYSPLTVTIGRQDLWFGKGFIVGAKQRDYTNSIGANEYTVTNAFDAIKGTLDFDPWKIDMVFSTIEENALTAMDNVYLTGANIGYKFSQYAGEAEGYYWLKQDSSKYAYITPTTSRICQPNTVNVIGGRGSFEPIQNASLAGELAYQWGRYSSFTQETRSRSAWALDLSGDYRFKDVKWDPKLGLEYIFYSGEENDGSGNQNGESWHGWNPMYRGKFDSAIREFQNIYYMTAMRGTNSGSTTIDQDSGATNEHQILLIGKLKPTTNITVDARVAKFFYAKVPTADRSKDIGTELDLTLTYDYTEDVSFNLLAGWFFPGKYWLTGQDDMATDVVGSVKVNF